MLKFYSHFNYHYPRYRFLFFKFHAIRSVCTRNMDISDSEKIKIDDSVKIIKEGSAEILEPPGKKVFYNPVQEFNRDLSVLALQTFLKNIQESSFTSVNILEPLSATGMRSIRYAKEVPKISKVIANDFSNEAIMNMEKNIRLNGVENIVQTSHSNAIHLMFNNIHPSQRFQVVDLDPYGSPTQFLDSAVQCVADGGILMVTCTDMSVLCGNCPETCYVKYGAVPLKCFAMHEMAIRIVLQSIQSQACKYRRYIVPLLSVSVDFYVRIFVKIYTSASVCKQITSKLSMVYQCNQCDSLVLQPLGTTKKRDKHFVYSLPYAPPVGSQCEHCGGKFHMGGPIWNAPIYDPIFVAEMLKSKEIHEFGTSRRLLGILSLIQEELLDVPLYYRVDQLCSNFRSATIPMMMFRSAILNAGYRVSFSHAAKQSLKTDAPLRFLCDIIREWIKENPVNPKKIIPGSSVEFLHKTPIESKIDFSLRPDANPLSREMKLTRYQENPMPFWGPGSKSTTMNLLENPKKLRNQNKKRARRENSDEIAKEPRLENTSEKAS